MNKVILAFIALALVLQSCSNKISYIQVFKTEATNSKKANNSYVFENDTLKITYYFWADAGVMAFRIYNKSDRPLYLDWKKSNFISNAFKTNYWADKSTVSTSWLASSYTLKSSYVNLDNYSAFNSNQNTVVTDNSINTQTQGVGINSTQINGSTSQKSVGSGTASTTISKAERVTFIPPRSYIQRARFILASDYYHDWKAGYTQIKEPRSDDPKSQTTISSKKFSISDSPLDFRNFLTFSYKEDFSNEFFVDNEFYISEIVAMDRRHFFIYKHDADNNVYREELSKYKDGVNFYVRTY